jgi:lysophospholipase L1-like esterase
MRKKLLHITFLLIICIVSGVAWTAYHFYAPPPKREPYKLLQQDDTLRIAYIGDSWACFHQDHHCLIPAIIESQCQRPTKVYSCGLSGKTSKNIYEALFQEGELKQFIQSRGYDFCVISAGLNDTNEKVCIKYFQKSMDYIIQFMLANHIYPIIFEIPDYDIGKAFRWKPTYKILIGQLSMKINNVPLDCKQMFRDALIELIHEKNYQDKVSVILYKSWNNNYSEDLKNLYLNDGVHLNDYGNEVLDSIIAKVIINKIQKTKYNINLN